MFHCSQCGKKVAAERVIFSETFEAAPVEFCSSACQYIWTDEMLAVFLARQMKDVAKCQLN